MDISTNNLSVLHSPALSSNLFGVSYKQFKRTYPGDYSFNFVLGLSSCNDFSVKNYTNFFLTERMKLSDIVDIDDDSASVVDVQVNIKSGVNTYLTYNSINANVGTPVFTTQPQTTVSNLSTVNLHFQIFDDNRCNIYFVNSNYKKYFLTCEDGTNNLYFVRERYLDFSPDTINPQDFTFLFSEDSKRVLLFKDIATETLILVKSGNNLVTTPVVEDQLDTYIQQSFTITRDLHFDPSQTLDFSFITYNEDNSIDDSKSLLSLRNNFLLHKKYSVKNAKTDILVLKNQLLVDDVFASANSLLSGGQIPLYVDDLREYTSIFDDIKEETTSDLELNYVFYNQSYKIKPGSNTFISPSGMYPFTKLNINDSKFIPSGAFGHITPEFSDRVYHISNEPQNSSSGQYLLCTWLSGSSLSDDKVWIDRYYYPDLIEKEAAIALKPFMYPTYDDYIEQLIANNTTLLSSISRQKIFDKISDFVFEPNQTYRYDRISQSLFTTSTSATPISPCNSVTQSRSVNYFKEINEAGKFTFSTYFRGDSSEWVIFSDRNAIDAGVDIVKTKTRISLTYILFNTATENYETFFTPELEYQPLKENFLCISVDSLAGRGYVCLNNDIVLSFTFDRFQYTNKRLIYGDLYTEYNGVKNNVLSYNGVTYDSIISTDFTPPELSFTIPLISGKVPVDDLYITLPCGMRNGTDNIAFLQQLCDSNAFRSNNINILVKNLNITNQSVLDGISQTITTSIKDFIPANSKVKNITFENYK